MAERYSYPNELRAKVAVHRARRMICWGALLLATLAFASVATWLHFGGHREAWFCLPVPLILLVFEELSFRRLEAQLVSILEVEGGWLRQVAPSGRVVAEINLGEMYDVLPAHTRGLPMLRVLQGQRHLEFSTLIDNGRALVEDILGKPWLPEFECQAK